jgi:hypothetical protein
LFRPSPHHFLSLVEGNLVKLPVVAEEDIKDKGKSDAILKTITLIQILWFACSSIARGVENLPLKTLELFTCALIFCSLLTIVMWWDKPYGLERPFCVSTTATIQELRRAVNGPLYKSSRRGGGRISLRDVPDIDDFTFTTYAMMKAAVAQLILFILFAGFGSWLLLGWNFYFNTPAERLLWRLASVGCTKLPILVLIIEQIPINNFGRGVWSL